MLNEVADVARQRGWLVIEETASPGVVTRLVTQHLPALLTELDPQAGGSPCAASTAPMGVGSIAWDSTDRHVVAAGLRNQLELTCDLLAEQGTGLLITPRRGPRLAHRRPPRRVRRRAAPVPQRPGHRRRRRRPAVGHQQPAERRGADVPAPRRPAHARPDRAAPRSSVPCARRSRAPAASISGTACRRAAAATGGYPFLIQLVGYHVWRQRPDQRAITVADVDAGAATAMSRMESLVHEPALADLSNVDRAFLAAMAMDDGPSRISDVAKRLGVELGYTSVYRQRLLDAQMIEPAGHGLLRFTLPRMTEHLRRRAGHRSGRARPPSAGEGDRPRPVTFAVVLLAAGIVDDVRPPAAGAAVGRPDSSPRWSASPSADHRLVATRDALDVLRDPLLFLVLAVPLAVLLDRLGVFAALAGGVGRRSAPAAVAVAARHRRDDRVQPRCRRRPADPAVHPHRPAPRHPARSCSPSNRRCSPAWRRTRCRCPT